MSASRLLKLLLAFLLLIMAAGGFTLLPLQVLLLHRPQGLAAPPATSSRHRARNGASAQARINTIEAQTMHLRQLRRVHPVRIKFLGNRAFNHYIAGTLKQANSPSALHVSDLENVMLGLFSSKVNLQKILTGGLTTQVVGLYDKHSKTLYIRDTGHALTIDRWVISHEFTHALQDEHFKLQKVEPDQSHWKFKNSDQDLAEHSLIEGDAVNIQYTYARTYYTQQQLTALNNEINSQPASHVPNIIEQQFEFPYQQGLFYVTYLISHGGFNRDDQAFRHPPNSTYEVMFPGRTLSPQIPKIRSMKGKFASWKRKDDDVMGAFGYYQLTEQYVSKASANHLASLWRGDRYLLLNKGHKYAMYFQAVFANPKAAQSADKILGAALATRFHHPLGKFHGGVFDGKSGTYGALRTSGRMVIMAYGPSSSIARSLVTSKAK